MTLKSLKTPVVILSVSVLALVGFAQDTPEKTQIVPEGDPGKGRELFEHKQCFRCHTVEGQKFPDADLPGVDFIHLGGANNRGWNRDLYAAQVMDPQHLISPDHQKAMAIVGDRLGAENSPMPDFKQALTVGDMIDLATYLAERSALFRDK